MDRCANYKTTTMYCKVEETRVFTGAFLSFPLSSGCVEKQQINMSYFL